MEERLRILIVDDQPRARSSLKALLAGRFEFAEVDEAADGAKAIRCVEKLKPGVVLMDVLMPEMDGLESTRLIKAMWPRVKVIVLSMHAEYRAAALAAGADAFVSKGEPPEHLMTTLAAMALCT